MFNTGELSRNPSIFSFSYQPLSLSLSSLSLHHHHPRYPTHLLLLLLLGDLQNARFLWKRIPKNIKEKNPELKVFFFLFFTRFLHFIFLKKKTFFLSPSGKLGKLCGTKITLWSFSLPLLLLPPLPPPQPPLFCMHFLSKNIERGCGK